MSTPPKAAQGEVFAAIERIARRREAIDDRNRDLLPNAPDSDPREVLRYLVRHTGNNIPLAVRQADTKDAMVLCNFLWWEHRRLELHFLEAGVANDVSLGELGGLVGVGRQGARDRIDRLTALLRFDEGPNEKAMRRKRREARAATTAPASSPEMLWLNENWPELSTVINGLAAEAERLDLPNEDREWLDELVLDAKEQHITRETMTMLGLATADLRVADAVLALSPRHPHKMHQLLRRADAMRTAFAGLGTRHR